MKSQEKIEAAIDQLIDGFEELQEEMEMKVVGRVLEDPESEPPPSEHQLQEIDSGFFTAVQSAVERTTERGRCDMSDLVAVVSIFADVLEEVAPELFEEDEEEQRELA